MKDASNLVEVDRHWLYECCVQRPGAVVELLTQAHGGSPLRLAEDFCGSAAVSRAWVGSDSRRTAVASDADAESLAIARLRSNAVAGCAERLRFALAQHGQDPGSMGAPASSRADVVFAGNFSIGELHDRASLLRYLRDCRERLGPEDGGGILACDTYGGSLALTPGVMVRTVVPETQDSGVLSTQSAGTSSGLERAAAPTRIIRYAYEQVSADPHTGRVENHLHFDVIESGELICRLRSAFVYRWRLWSVPEIRDAMTEAGLCRSDVVTHLDRESVADGREERDWFAALVVGRVSPR